MQAMFLSVSNVFVVHVLFIVQQTEHQSLTKLTLCVDNPPHTAECTCAHTHIRCEIYILLMPYEQLFVNHLESVLHLALVGIMRVNEIFLTVFSCDQAALWMVQSILLSVCLSVRLSVTPFWLCSHHCIIIKFSGVITNDKSDAHAKGQGQGSKVKVTEVFTQLSCFWTVNSSLNSHMMMEWCVKLDVA